MYIYSSFMFLHVFSDKPTVFCCRYLSLKIVPLCLSLLQQFGKWIPVLWKPPHIFGSYQPRAFVYVVAITRLAVQTYNVDIKVTRTRFRFFMFPKCTGPVHPQSVVNSWELWRRLKNDKVPAQRVSLGNSFWLAGLQKRTWKAIVAWLSWWFLTPNVRSWPIFVATHFGVYRTCRIWFSKGFQRRCRFQIHLWCWLTNFNVHTAQKKSFCCL